MIIVTGAAGFIGYRVSERLMSQGEQVIGVDAVPLFHSRPEHRNLPFHSVVEPEAILNPEFFGSLNRAGTPVKGIIHMGACTDTTEMRLEYLKKVNLEYSQALWNLAIQFQVPFVYASSAATYGAGEQGYDDDESRMRQLRPLNPHGDSKLQFDLWALSEEKTGRAPPAWSGFKFFNVYGFGDRHKGKMSSVVLQGFDQIRSAGKLRLFRSHRIDYRDGEQKRDFVWVDDVVSVLEFALRKPIRRGIFNLGSGKARSFKDLALATFAALNAEPVIEYIDTPLEIRDRYQYFTQAEMRKLVTEGYHREFASLETGVSQTVKALLAQLERQSL